MAFFGGSRRRKTKQTDEQAGRRYQTQRGQRGREAALQRSASAQKQQRERTKDSSSLRRGDRSARFSSSHSPHGAGDGSSAALQWARDYAMQGTAKLQATRPVLIRLSANVPWRPTTGRSQMLHPLRREKFWTEFLGRRAAVLRRGPLHPLPLSVPRAVSLLRHYRIGVNAAVMLSGQGLAYQRRSRAHGMEAFAALSQGMPVRLDGLERRLPHLLARDPFAVDVARMAPGRGLTASLFWAPPGGAALPAPLEERYEQIVVQLYGARRWTVCRQGQPPSAGAPGLTSRERSGAVGSRMPAEPVAPKGENTAVKRAACTETMLRRGDMLILPSRSWHWTAVGPSASAHLTLGFVPAIVGDLLVVAGARTQLVRMGSQPALGRPLPLWRSRYPEDVADEAAALCQGLPWGGTDARTSTMVTATCSPAAVRIALLRLVGPGRYRQKATNGMWASGTDRNASNANQSWQTSPRKRMPRRATWNVASSFAQCLGILCALFFFAWMCVAINSSDDGSQGGPGRGSRRLHRKMSSKRNRYSEKLD